jgi:hypothetical protein
LPKIKRSSKVDSILLPELFIFIAGELNIAATTATRFWFLQKTLQEELQCLVLLGRMEVVQKKMMMN